MEYSEACRLAGCETVSILQWRKLNNGEISFSDGQILPADPAAPNAEAQANTKSALERILLARSPFVAKRVP